MGQWQCEERAWTRVLKGDQVEGGREQGAERTRNMYSMVVTLDVSKLSGWLNVYDNCPAERRAYDVGGMRAGRSERVGWWRCIERACTRV